MKALLGRKIGMSQMFSPDGEVVPVTLILARPNIVLLRKLEDRDGYAAVQLALPRKESSSKPGEEKQTPRRLKDKYAVRREFRISVEDNVEQLTVEQFAVGDQINVSGISKGKGFQGVVKRHGFKGGPASHGHRHVLRSPGSIGSAYPQHVMKGKRMAGRMGYERVTVKNLTVWWVDIDKDLLAIKGAVPGRRGSVVEIRSIASAKSESQSGR